MKKVIYSIYLLLGSAALMAQQDAMFTHYSFNTLAVNSGYAGSRDALTVTGLHRSQWVSFPGSPTTQTLTLHAPISNDRMGLGFSILNDKIGPTKQTAFYGDFAYKIKIGKGKLAFGLKAGLNMVSNDLADLSTTTINDVSFGENTDSKLLPNFGFGLYYSTSKWYLGLSTPRLLENDYESNTTSGSLGGEKRHYFLIAGMVFNLNETGSVKLRPTTFIKTTEGVPSELDLTALFYIKDKFWIGPMWRSGDALGALVGLNVTDQLSCGYSYDWSYGNRTFKYNSGSHEIMLRYDFIFKDKSRIRSPRYF